MNEPKQYREQVAAAIQATVVHSSTGYSWFGVPSEPYPRRLAEALTARSSRTLLLFDLQDRLSTDFYCRGGAAPSGDDEPPLFEVERTDFLAELAAANGARGYCENNG